MPEAPKPVGLTEAPRGMYPGRLDDKGRLKLPAVLQKYFDSLPEKKVFVTSLDRRTAAIYPIAAWRATEQFFDNYHKNPKAAKAVFFTATKLGSEVEPDSQGRVLFNSDLRKVLKLEGTELHMYAYRGHVEVMTDEIYLEQDKVSEETAVSAHEILQLDGMP